MSQHPVSRRRVKKSAIAGTLITLLLLAFSLSACGGNPQTQQQATTSKASLDQLITHAQSIGVPATMLQPILQQEAQISTTNAPIGIFSDQSTNDYYSNLSQRYQSLAVQVRGLEYQAGQQLDYQASLNLQGFETILAQRKLQGFAEAKTFADRLTQDQKALAQAQYPKDYLLISSNAQNSMEALQLMGPAYSSLTTFQQDIKQLQASHLDTTALNLQYQQDLKTFRGATQPQDFSTLITQLNAQLQETTVYSTQAIPYVGAAKLQQFSADIVQLKSVWAEHYSLPAEAEHRSTGAQHGKIYQRLPEGLRADRPGYCFTAILADGGRGDLPAEPVPRGCDGMGAEPSISQRL